MHNKAKVFFHVLLLTGAVILMTVPAQAEDFSASITSKTRQGLTRARIFCSGEKVRTEMEQATSIARIDKGVMWVLMPGQKVYMEVPLENNNSVVAGLNSVPGEIERLYLGQENVNGVMASKYRIVYESGKNMLAMFTWLPPGSSVPVKSAAEDASWEIEYKDIRMGPQPESLFEVPEGYTKLAMDMPGLSNIGDMSGLEGLQ